MHNTRVIPSKHSIMTQNYARILRGIHYRHEFARRNPGVVKETGDLFRCLGIAPESASEFETPSGKFLPEIVSLAYRRSMRSPAGAQAKNLLRRYFVKNRVLPVAPLGPPFLGNKLRLMVDVNNQGREITESDHQWLKEIWNVLLAFEMFAMAEFSLPHPIMMPAMILPIVKTRSTRIPICNLVEPSLSAFAMFVNPSQTEDILSIYMKAMIEQVRESGLYYEGTDAQGSPIRLDDRDFERYLNVLDLKSKCGKRVSFSEKKSFYWRHNIHTVGKYDAKMKYHEYFKANFARASMYRDNWALIL